MSNKGAVKKTVTSDAVARSSRISGRQSQTKEDDETIPKSNRTHSRKPQLPEHKGDGDRHSRLTLGPSISKSQIKRTSVKESSTSLSKSHKDSNSSLALKSSRSNANKSIRPSVSSSHHTDTSKKHSSSSVTRNSKNTGNSQPGYSEKRGLSTIYIPRSTTNKPKTKSTNGTSFYNNERIESKNSKQASPSTQRVPRERKLSRTLSPSEVKMLHSATKPPASGRANQKNLNSDSFQKDGNDDYEYEDDFEDYESDFQECSDSDGIEISEKSSSSQSSTREEPIELRTQGQRKTVHSAELKTEEERMLDSGHYELAEARKRAAMMESLVTTQSTYPPPIELRQPTNKAYSEDKPAEQKSLPSSTDEGFEDSRSGDFTRTPPLSQISCIDFRKPKGHEIMKKPKKKTRGEELLEMIKLDTMQWSLFECSPIPYDEFIRCFGKLNTLQISTQTGEDNIDVDTQTDKVATQNKWTQFPVKCRTNLSTKEDLDLFRMEQVGVGGDEFEMMNSKVISHDALRLNDFVNRAGGVMLSLLEEKKFGGNIFQDKNHNLEFSDSFVKLSVNSITFLSGRRVTAIHYSENFNKILVTVHASAEEEIETSSKQDYITDCCIGCVWNISEPSSPMKLFYSSYPITSCCLHSANYNIVLAGLQDGTISVWDLKEDEMWHQKVTDKANELDWTIRTPTYTSAAAADTPTHNSQIVAIRVLSKIEEKSSVQQHNKFVPIQICSLDEEGFLVIWSLLHDMGIKVDDLGLSHWGNIRLVKNQEMHLMPRSEKIKVGMTSFIDMRVDRVDANNIYVATNATSVIRATCMGNKTNPTVYEKADLQPSGNVTCIDICPFEHSFFLVGCDDGSVRLHSLEIEKPILELKDEKCTIKIKAVQWSKSKIFTIYVLDANSCIHIWDLSVSDINCSYMLDMKTMGCISTMELSSCRTERDMMQQYLALGTETGKIEIHKLKTDFCHNKKEDCKKEVDTFMRYVSIL